MPWSALLRAAAFFYRFDSFAYVKGTASINTWAAYERLEESSTHGGFFATSTVHELYEDIKSGRVANVSVIAKVSRTYGYSTRLDDFGSATTLVNWTLAPR